MSNDKSIATSARALEQMVYHAVMEFSPWPMAEVEGAGHIVQAINPAFCEMLKKGRDELIGVPLDEVFAEDHATHGLLERVLSSGKAASHIETAANTPGPIYWSYTCWPVQSKGSLHAGLMIQVTETATIDARTQAVNEALLISSVRQHELTHSADRLNERLHQEIAERQKAELAARSSDERLRVALASADLGTWILDPATDLFHVDERYRAIFSTAAPAISLAQGMEVVHPDDRERVAMEVKQALAEKRDKTIETEYRIVHPDGSVHWVLSRGRAVFDPEGTARKLSHFAGTVADITARKQLELALEKTAKDLLEVDRHKSEFLATLAHELRNPLAPLRHGLDLLSFSMNDQATWDQTHGMMKRQLDHLVRLIDDLMDLSRISRGVIDLRKEQFDLRAVLEQAVETSRTLIEKQGHTCTLEMPDEPVTVDGDAMRLNQVFCNLLNNAAKYTDGGGAIAVRAQVSADEVRVMVEDNGIGIAPDQLAKVFDMFAQVERTNERVQGGLGIGLNIVKHLVEMHDGRIDVRSGGLRGGSTFTVVLPLARHLRISAPSKTVPTAATTSRMRILIVDDNEDAATMMSLLLGHYGHDLRVAHNGQQALAIGAEIKPDLVLMDIGMPVMDGNAACLEMKRTPWGRAAYVVALTGLGQDEDRMKSTASGFDHHLVKPVASEALMKVLTACAQRRSAAAGP